MEKFAARNIKVLGISLDSPESHRDFIKKHGLTDLTLLSDKDGRVARQYKAKSLLLPVAKRVYLVVDKEGQIVFRKKKFIFPLENQSETLLQVIDDHIS